MVDGTKNIHNNEKKKEKLFNFIQIVHIHNRDVLLKHNINKTMKQHNILSTTLSTTTNVLNIIRH